MQPTTRSLTHHLCRRQVEAFVMCRPIGLTSGGWQTDVFPSPVLSTYLGLGETTRTIGWVPSVYRIVGKTTRRI